MSETLETLTNNRSTVPGFWTRLALAIEAMGESYEERLEQRVSRLETEVARFSQKLEEARGGPALRSGQVK